MARQIPPDKTRPESMAHMQRADLLSCRLLFAGFQLNQSITHRLHFSDPTVFIKMLTAIGSAYVGACRLLIHQRRWATRMNVSIVQKSLESVESDAQKMVTCP